MGRVKRRIFLPVISVVLGSACLVGVSNKADAGVIPYSVSAPHEGQLPVGNEIPKDGINIGLSYDTYRDEGKAYNGESPVRSTFLSINKLAHIFKIDGLDDFGFLWEGLLGFGNVQLKNNISETGMIDGQLGLAAWWKPTKNWTHALEYWLYVPIGSDNLSSHSWGNSICWMSNYHNGGFTFDSSTGYKFNGDYRDQGKHLEQGGVYFANVVFAYKFMKNIEPFVRLDFQTTESGKDKATGAKTPGQHELAWGIGNYFKITDRLDIAVFYAHGIDGRNTTKTNAGVAKIIWMF